MITGDRVAREPWSHWALEEVCSFFPSNPCKLLAYGYLYAADSARPQAGL